MNPDPKRDEALLNALLGGEPWADVNEAVKRAALAEFHARQHRRRVQFWILQAAACAAVALGGIWLAQRTTPTDKAKDAVVAQAAQKIPTPTAENLPDESSIPAAKSTGPALADLANLPSSISEEQMLALFPRGSCIIAEIDGQKQLIFFDQKIAAEGAPYHPGS